MIRAQGGGVVVTEQEWLEIGRKNGVIEKVVVDPCSFEDVYQKWFCMKMGVIKPQSLDRIEVTYNKYYRNARIASEYLSEIDTAYVSDYLNKLLLEQMSIAPKEFKKIYQIVNNVLEYAYDLNIGAPCPINWNVVKRYLPANCIKAKTEVQYAVPDETIVKLFHDVVYQQIYFEKQSACLCLVLNFFLALRIGELAALKWTDIDWSRRVVRVCKTESKCFLRDNSGNRVGSMLYTVRDDVKTVHSIREVPLCDISVQLLRLLRSHHDTMKYRSEFLAYDGCDSGVLVRSLDRVLRRLCKLSQVPYFNSHLIRKTFASKMHNQGLSSRIIADIIGHADIQTTEEVYILSYLDNWDYVIGCMNEVFRINF